MEDLVDTLTRGNPLEVKTVLGSVAFALAAYQVVLAAVGFRWVRPTVPEAEPAFRAHRASGDAILVLLVIVGAMCLAVAGEDHGGDDAAFHAVTGGLLFIVLALGGRLPVMNRQVLGSLLVALAIVAITIVVVTAKLGPNAGERDDGGGNSGKEKSEQRDDH